MTVHVYTLCYNEMAIAPFVVDYWKRIKECVDDFHVFVYDNQSTDGSREFLSKFDWISIINLDMPNIRDDYFVKIKDIIWKQSKDEADFVIVSDFDEVIYSSDLHSALEDMKKRNCCLLRPIWFNACSEKYPKYIHGKLYHEIQPNVVRGKSKCILFNPNDIKDIHYSIFCNDCNPEFVNDGGGNFEKFYDKYNKSIYAFHLNDLGADYLVYKYHHRRNRLSIENRNRGWRINYLYTDSKIRKIHNENFSHSFSIMNLFKANYMKKRLVYFIYAKIPSPDVYKIHYQCLKLYSNIFDEMQFVISVDNKDTNAFEYYKKKILEIVSFKGDTRKIEFAMVDNDPVNREFYEFKTYVIDQLPKLKDTYLFYAHGKGVSNEGYMRMVNRWIYGMYYFNLNFIDDVIEKFSYGYDSYGSMLLNEHGPLFSGTYLWFNCNNFHRNFNELVDKIVKIYTKRYLSERFIQHTSSLENLAWYRMNEHSMTELKFFDDYKHVDEHMKYMYGVDTYKTFFMWMIKQADELDKIKL